MKQNDMKIFYGIWLDTLSVGVHTSTQSLDGVQLR